MVRSVDEMIKESQQQARNIRQVGVYDQAGGSRQAIAVQEQSADMSADVSAAQAEYLTDVNQVQKDLIKRQQQLQQQNFEQRAKITEQLHKANEPFEAHRNELKSEVQDDVARLRELNKEQENAGFFGKIVSGFKEGFLRADLKEKVKDTNLVTGMMTDNYNQAALRLKEYTNNTYMKNAAMLRMDAKLQANKLKLRGQKLGLITQQMQKNEKTATNIMNYTRDPRRDGAITEKHYNDPFVGMMHTLRGKSGKPTKPEVRTYLGVKKDVGAEGRQALTRGVIAYMDLLDAGEQPSAEGLLEVVADRGNIAELNAVAKYMPTDLQFAVSKSGSAMQERIIADETLKYKEQMVKEDPELNTVDDVRLREKDHEAIQGNAQRELQAARKLPARSMFAQAQDDINSKSRDIIDPSGNEITPKSLGEDDTFLANVLPKYGLSTPQYLQTLSSEQFQTGFTGTTSSQEGLLEKQVFMAERLIADHGISEDQAFGLVAEAFKEMYTGKLVQQNPESVIYQRFVTRPEPRLTMTLRGGNPAVSGYFGREEYQVDPFNGSDLMNYRARKDQASQEANETNQMLSGPQR